jgi:hypothetical protein
MGRLLSMAVLAGMLAGCHDPVTEVVVVMQSDLAIPTDADRIIVSFNSGIFPPMIGGFDTTNREGNLFGRSFPLSLGFTSGGGTSTFSITVQLLHGTNQAGAPNIAVGRTVTDIRFVDQEMMMFMLPLLRVCACEGTSCPNVDNPDCQSFQTPVLEPLDPAMAVPSATMLGP